MKPTQTPPSIFDTEPDIGATTAEPTLRSILAQYYRQTFSAAVSRDLTDKYIAALSVPAAAVVGKPVAWLHPTANWCDVDRQKVLNHCVKDGDLPVPIYAAPSAPDGYVQQLEKALKLAADRLDASSHRVGENDSRAAFGIAQWAIEARAALGGASHE